VGFIDDISSLGDFRILKTSVQYLQIGDHNGANEALRPLRVYHPEENATYILTSSKKPKAL
jgi:hypothetical protein